MKDDKITLGLVQTAVSGDPTANLKKACEKIQKVSREGAQIVCLQELFRTRYFCQTEDPRNFDLAESIPGPATEVLSQIACRESIVLIAPLFEKTGEGIYFNTAVVFDTVGQLIGRYRKMHIPHDPCFYEKFYFKPGDLGFGVFQTVFGRIGVLICWDQWFPEAARLAALQGAKILFYPTAIGWHEAESSENRKLQLEAWEIVQRSHAIANQIFVAAVNRVGAEGELTFWGNSFVSDPFGSLLVRAGGLQEETLLCECDLGKIEEFRETWPFWRDRRPEAYGEIAAGEDRSQK